MLMTIHLRYFRESQFPSVNLDLTMFKRIKNKKRKHNYLYSTIFLSNILHYWKVTGSKDNIVFFLSCLRSLLIYDCICLGTLLKWDLLIHWFRVLSTSWLIQPFLTLKAPCNRLGRSLAVFRLLDSFSCFWTDSLCSQDGKKSHCS